MAIVGFQYHNNYMNILPIPTLKISVLRRYKAHFLVRIDLDTQILGLVVVVRVASRLKTAI